MPLVQVKNVSPVPVDARGRMLAPGETADLDPDDPDIADHLTDGRLTTVQTTPARSGGRTHPKEA